MPEMRLRPAVGAYSALPDPLAGFKGPTSKGRGVEGREGRGGREGKGGEGREGKGRGRAGRGKGRGGTRREGKGRVGGLTPTFLYPPPPL